MSGSLTTERYDRFATGYARWWAPVLEPTALRVLDLADGAAAGRGHVLDVGTGTGTLALAAVRRWPTARVTAIDASRGMVEVARAAATRALEPAPRRRLGFRVALADRLPFADRSFDVAISSFVLQLVPNRSRALREIRRVLKPGGTLAWVTWQAGRDGAFEPDLAFDDALDEIGVGARWEPDGRSGDVPSPEAAVAQLRRAGFHAPEARTEWLEHGFDEGSYFAFMTEFDEQDLVESLEPDERDRFFADLRARLRRLAPQAFVFRAPVVFARAVRSGR